VPDLYKVQFYQSKNLLKWDLMSEFGNAGDTTRIWECPDLYQLPVENEPGKSKWVLSLSGGHPAGPKFVGMQYFVGEFDGAQFTSPQKDARYVDHGKDFYAGIVYNNVPDSTVMVGWINNWTYANDVPTSPWRGAMSIPRKLSLKQDGDEFQLLQRPVKNINYLRGGEVSIENTEEGSLEIELEWNGGQGTIIELFSNGDEKTVVGLSGNRLFIDRTHSGQVDFQPDFASTDAVEVRTGPLKLHLFVDQSIIELYANDGEATITSQVFPNGRNHIAIPQKENVVGLKVWELASAWK
jgi:fructan beta-fructosidase